MQNQIAEKLDTAALKRLAEMDEGAKRFFAAASGRTNDVASTTVSRIRQMSKVTPKEALALCKALEKAHVGKLLLGRHGAVSRMRWNYSMRAIGRFATGLETKIPEALEEDVTDDVGREIGLIGDDDEQIITSAVDHRFLLRPGMIVLIRLPADFNKRDAERLAGWLHTLPFED